MTLAEAYARPCPVCLSKGFVRTRLVQDDEHCYADECAVCGVCHGRGFVSEERAAQFSYGIAKID